MDLIEEAARIYHDLRLLERVRAMPPLFGQKNAPEQP